MSKKYSCPSCGSSNIVYVEEIVVEKRYKLRNDGTPYKRHYEATESGTDPNYHLECTNCKEYVNLNDTEELEKWFA